MYNEFLPVQPYELMREILADHLGDGVMVSAGHGDLEGHTDLLVPF